MESPELLASVRFATERELTPILSREVTGVSSTPARHELTPSSLLESLESVRSPRYVN